MDQFTLRVMTAADLPAADGLRALIGWNQTVGDWHRLLRLEPQGCFVALKDSHLIGTVTTTAYGQALAWIGMMLVHPEHRRQGVARQLMQRAICYLQVKSVEVIKLDATPAGQPLYGQLGFVPEWTLTRWQSPAGSSSALQEIPVSQTRALEEGDWPAILELDRAALGADRPALLHSLARQSKKARVWPAEGPVLGWGLLRQGANAEYLGPVACARPEGALALLLALVPRPAERATVWDIPDTNELAQAAAPKLGFSRLRPLTRMRRGPCSPPANPLSQFAIADPAVG